MRWPERTVEPKTCLHCGGLFSKPKNIDYATFEKRKFCSQKCSNSNHVGGQFVKGLTPWNKGKKCPQLVLSEEARARKSASLKTAGAGKWRKGIEPWNKGKRLQQFSGANNANWKGGITVKTRGLRWSADYAAWRRKVFERDKFTCQFCGQVGGTLNADHIKPLKYYPELIFELTNGRTLCEPCHKKTDTYGTKVLTWKETGCE